MSTRNLDKLMAPRSVVAIGASARPGSVGAAVTRNLLAGGFQGEIHLVNRKGGEIAGRHGLPQASGGPAGAGRSRRHHDAGGDRARADRWSWARRARAPPSSSAPVPATGADAATDNARWRQRLLRAAQPHLLRIVGPNCIGYAAPRLGLNASFGPAQAQGRAHRRDRPVGRRAGRARRLGQRRRASASRT